jgi:tRNA pseudouridine55 synthase
MAEASPAEGVLLIDKPQGPTSHDVVARLRRVLGERRIGHTGTLDPMASGLLPLVVGRATRLAPYLSSGAKTYHATIRFGFATTTDDAAGEPLAAATLPLPTDDDVHRALDGFRGTFDQRPPRHSAKHVGGIRAYALARQDRPVDMVPVPVTVLDLDWIGRSGDLLMIRVTATAGFYVRSLARELGDVLGCGGHLAALRRTASGRFQVADALPLQQAEQAGSEVRSRLIGASAALAHLPGVRLAPGGVTRVSHGNWAGPEHVASGDWPQEAGPSGAEPIRLLEPGTGRLLALARLEGGVLHPVVVLG